MLFHRHEMGGSMTGGRGRIDVIANQNGSSGKQQAVELTIKLRDAARVAKLVHGLERDDEIEAGVNPVNVARSVYDSNHMGRLKLFGAVLSAMRPVFVSRA